MEKQKTSKKALRNLIEGSLQDALKTLELPEPGKKAKKVLHRNSRKLASIFSDVIKQENKKKRKAEKLMETAVSGKNKTGKKDKSRGKHKKRDTQPVVEQPRHFEAV